MKGNSFLIFASLSIAFLLSWSTIWANIMNFEGAGSTLEPAPDLSEVVMCDNTKDALNDDVLTPVCYGEFNFHGVKFLASKDGTIYMAVSDICAIADAMQDEYQEWKKLHDTTE